MIHATALVHPEAKLGDGVRIGPYSMIGEHVEIGAGTSIASHVVIEGRTRIGRDNRIFQFASLGAEPQDKKYRGEPTALVIGDRNTIREYTTINTGTVQDGGVTVVGSDNWLMAYVHIAHDCRVEDHTVFANNAQIAGHCYIGAWAFLGGFTGVHQFVRIGAHAMTGGGTILVQDLPPFVTAAGNPAKPYGVNAEGLRRRGFSAESIAAIKRAYRVLYRSGLDLEQARRPLEESAQNAPELSPLVEFLAAAKRGILR